MASPSHCGSDYVSEVCKPHASLSPKKNIGKNLGIQIQRGTLSNWIIMAAEEWLSLEIVMNTLMKSFFNKTFCILTKLQSEFWIRADPKNTTRSAYMWVYTSGVNSDYPIRIFEYLA